MPQENPRGIYNRGYLPHWDFPGALQAVTFRLADSVPHHLIQQWLEELEAENDIPLSRQNLHRRIAQYEDAGHGEALLVNPSCAECIQEQLIARHRTDYLLRQWVIMPNHVHVLLKPKSNVAISSIIKRWKGASAVAINRTLERTGTLWAREYHDRWIRDEAHMHNAIAYIRNNPVKAGLCERPEDWPYSSAGTAWNDRDDW